MPLSFHLVVVASINATYIKSSNEAIPSDCDAKITLLILTTIF